jgi:uncharacterized protein YutE (UPF0331/DUF86 family)
MAGKSQRTALDPVAQHKSPALSPEKGFTTVVALWMPRRFLASSGVLLEDFVADVNQTITKRGFVLWDGQILRTPLDLSDDIDVIDEGGDPFEVPACRDWGPLQQRYFDLGNPYQMVEDPRDYTQTHIMTRVRQPYLYADERISALVHGGKDNCYFYCTCHYADVVYTTRHRLVCMMCGAMHAVLRKQLSMKPKRLLSAEDWADLFDDAGARREEEIDLTLVDFQDLESAEKIWTTEQWEDAKHRFVFFARSSPEVIEAAIRGTDADPSIFLEAGWTEVPLPPPPAHQISDDSVDVDLLENAAHSLREGVTSYLAARYTSIRLVNALPQMFRAVELLLKARLQQLDSKGLTDNPNNPTVLNRLQANGVVISKDEIDALTRLRRFRNKLQHGTATLNQRAGLSICRKTIIFLNRFTYEELEIWLGDAIPPDDWYALLSIPEISATSDTIVKSRLESVNQQSDASVDACPRCGCDALVRPHKNTGASCFYCGHVPVCKE